jgi:hypothetical protein
LNRGEETAWAAGLFEGEGCVSRYITTKRSRQYGYWQTKLSSTDLDVVERFCEIVGVGRIYVQKRSNPDWKPAYQHCIYRQPEVLATLELLRPFMLARRAAKIDEALTEMRGRVYKPGRRATPQRELASR